MFCLLVSTCSTWFGSSISEGSGAWINKQKKICRLWVSDLYLDLHLYWSRKVGYIMYLICSRSTWTRDIWLDFAWVDLLDNKFGNHTRDVYRSNFFWFWFHVSLSIHFISSTDPLAFIFCHRKVSGTSLTLFGFSVRILALLS